MIESLEATLSPIVTTVNAYLSNYILLFLLVGYKVLDGFADVYESEFQRCGRLYLTGKSNTFRTLLSVGVVLLTLLAGRNLLLSCCAALAAPIASQRFSRSEVGDS